MFENRKEKKIEFSIISDIMRRYECHTPAEPEEIAKLLQTVRGSVSDKKYAEIVTDILYAIAKATS